jgi:hypothetical protein
MSERQRRIVRSLSPPAHSSQLAQAIRLDIEQFGDAAYEIGADNEGSGNELAIRQQGSSNRSRRKKH